MRKLGLVIAAILGAVACSIPSDETARVIDDGDLAPSLQENPSTTTSTTVPEILTREFAYFLLANQEDTEQRQVQQVVAPIEQGTLFEAIELMEVEGFKARIGAEESLFNVVPQYDVVDVRLDNGTATVFLLTLGDAPDNPVLRDVAAQLVWTLTGDAGVDDVLINIDDVLAQLPTTNDDNLTDRPVTIDDYTAYNAEPEVDPAETTTTTSSTTTTTTTTVPPSDG